MTEKQTPNNARSASLELKIFRAAHAYHRASDMLDRDIQTKIPSYALRAFACELYLKCLIAVEGKKPSETHDLRQLFFELSRESQKQIRRAYKEMVKKRSCI